MADNHLIRIHQTRSGGFRKAALPLVLLPLLAVGCAGQPMQMGTFARSVPNENAMVLPPPAGPGIVSVVERRYDNAVDQQISLFTSAQTPGQNMLKAQFFGTQSSFDFSDNKLGFKPVTESGVSAEIRAALPGIRMARSGNYVQNNYGPFGYAMGHGAGSDLCMYAWQQVRSPSGTISPFANFGSIQIRLRVCQSNATEQQLLAIAYNYTITGAVDASGWNPYGEPQSVPATLGATGAPIYPRATMAEPIVAPQTVMTVQTRPVVQPRRTVMRRRAVAPVATAPAPVAPTQQVPALLAIPDPASTQRPAPSRQPVTVPSPTAMNGTLPTGRPAPILPTSTASAMPATPRVPSPTGVSTPPRHTTVPSPACSNTFSGANNAC